MAPGELDVSLADMMEQARDEVNRDAAAGFHIEPHGPYDHEYQIDLTPVPCPDQAPWRDGKPFEVDAQLLLNQVGQRGRMKLSAQKKIHIANARDLQAFRESSQGGRFKPSWKMAESADPREKMREWGATADPFAYGNSLGGGGSVGEYVPLWPGPVTRQLYWQDYFAMSAKAFEAYNHDPISWRAIHLKQEFVLGKGVQSRVTYDGGSKAGQTHDLATKTWEEYWKRNNMDDRMDKFCRDISWGGETFFRFFKKGRLLSTRTLDPASVYDLITDPEDIETVFGYHQQFQTAYQLYAPGSSGPTTGTSMSAPSTPSPFGPTASGTATKFIIRQIAPQEIDHYKINTSAFERRGRSDLYPGLAWIKKLRDYLTSHVTRVDMLSRIAWDLQVQGNGSTVSALMGQLFPGGQPPRPGGVFAHNQASTLSVMAPDGSEGNSGRYDPMLLALVTMIGNSVGVPADWLGFSTATTRANALVATEPAAHSLEELQGLSEMVVHNHFDRCMTTAGITDAQLEVTFPSIASEDRSQLLQDLSYAEANQWISKRTAASIAAKEMDITTYDFDEEQAAIADEFNDAQDGVDDGPPETDPTTGLIKPKVVPQGDGKIRTPMIIASNRQAPKLDPTRPMKDQDFPAGLIVGPDGAPAAAPGGSPGGDDGGPPSGPKSDGDGPSGDGPSRAGNTPASENPLAAAGAKSIKAANAAESERVYTQAELDQKLREAKDIRRTPDDPEHQRLADEYKAKSAANWTEMLDSVIRESEKPRRFGRRK